MELYAQNEFPPVKLLFVGKKDLYNNKKSETTTTTKISKEKVIKTDTLIKNKTNNKKVKKVKEQDIVNTKDTVTQKDTVITNAKGLVTKKGTFTKKETITKVDTVIYKETIITTDTAIKKAVKIKNSKLIDNNDANIFDADAILNNLKSKYETDQRVKIASKNFKDFDKKETGSFLLSKETFAYNPNTNMVTSDSNIIAKGNRLSINHYKNNLISKYLIRLKSSNILPKPVDQKKLDSFSQLFDTCKIDLNRILVKDKNDNCKDKYIYDEETAIRLKSLVEYFGTVNCYFDSVVKDNKPWMESWLWFTKRNVRINPFGVYDPSDKLKEFNLSLITVNEQLDVLSKRLACCDNDSEEFYQIKAEHDELLKNKKIILSKINALNDVKIQFDNWLKQIQVKNVLIYKLPNMPSSNENKINWIYNYDAANGLTFLNNDGFNNSSIFCKKGKYLDLESPYSIWEKDKVIVAVHNIEEGQTVGVKAVGEVIQLKSKVEIAFDPWMDAFAESFKGVGSINTIGNVIKGFVPQNNKLKNNFDERLFSDFDFKGLKINNIMNSENISDDLRVKYEQIILSLTNKTITKEELNKLKEKYSESEFKSLFRKLELEINTPALDQITFEDYSKIYQQALDKFKWLEEQTIPFIDYELKEDVTPMFETKLFDPEKILPQKGNKITYTITSILNKDTIKISNTYVKHDLKWLYPTVGVGYIIGSRSNSIYNATTNSFDPNFDYDNIEAYAGVKWYPWRMNITSDKNTRKFIRKRVGKSANIIRGNSWENSLSVVFAFGVRHKFLKNYILGVSFDLTPGIAIQAGGNIFFQNRYKLENNAVIDAVEVPIVRPFVGISIDLGIANSLVKLFKGPSL